MRAMIDGILFYIPSQLMYGYVETNDDNDKINRNPPSVSRTRVLLR